MNDLNRMKELSKLLNEAAKSYYQDDTEIMTNLEYDKLYDELEHLEKAMDMVLAGSPTNKVGYELLSSLPKEAHNSPMLSLAKTKERDELLSWLGDNEGMLSFKLDGLTIVLSYSNGQLVKAVTRGNGAIGEVVTNNAKVFKNIPLSIPYKENLTIRGEAIIRYSDFLSINEELDVDNQYKNPRNLCSGSVRQLNNEVTSKRHVRFYGFNLVDGAIKAELPNKSDEIEWLTQQGIECVEYIKVTRDNLYDGLDSFAKMIESNDVGSDGLVLTYNDKAYSETLGTTSKFPKDTMAFKWQDEEKETTLKDVFWSASRTGMINPVAVFEPVELEGTSVARASLHNISIIEKLELGIGDTIRVYKANMIIPQIAENESRTGTLEIPTICPVCHEETTIKDVNDIKVLFCDNTNCPAKMVKGFSHFVSRNAMNIEGLSEATLEKLIQLGILTKFSDLFQLDNEEVREVIVNLDGFGEKSYNNLLESLNKSKTVKLANLIFSLGILHVGLSNAKLLAKAFNNDIETIMNADVESLVAIEGYGEVIAKSLYEYFHDEEKRSEFVSLLDYIEIEKVEAPLEARLEGKVFVITGSLETYANRNALKEVIENQGGKVTGSVSAKTNYLINNDKESSSSKNKKAKSLDIPIISEQDFNQLIE